MKINNPTKKFDKRFEQTLHRKKLCEYPIIHEKILNIQLFIIAPNWKQLKYPIVGE